MLSRKKTADAIINILLFLKNDCDISPEEFNQVHIVLQKLYDDIMNELYPGVFK